MNLHEEIAAVAYEFYESKGCLHGFDLDDWLNAERCVLGMHSGQDLEEPEEENGPGELAAVGAIRAPAEEGDEPINEEMS